MTDLSIGNGIFDDMSRVLGEGKTEKIHQG